LAADNLGSCIFKSLQLGEMASELPSALLTPAHNKARHRNETKYWDYKGDLQLTDVFKVAEFAKDVLAFHNTDGGLIVAGITNEYTVQGIPGSSILDTKQLKDKIRSYVGLNVDIFQNSIEVPDHKLLWLVFVRKYLGSPQAVLKNGPDDRSGRPMFVRGDYFYREADEVRRCINDGDIERVFRGFSSEHLNAYNYEVDDNYFRLLNPNYETFIGRRAIIDEVKQTLDSRHPVVALDGLGGVGKTAVAIQAVRELYQEKKYYFIVSLSAKSKVWLGYVQPRQATFASLHGLLLEMSDVFRDIPKTNDLAVLKRAVLSFMEGMDGLILIDNLEEVDDPGVLRFLSREIPDPVKVLITSRIDKNLGALTISVPAMTAQEAEDLLRSELDRLGCEIRAGEEKFFREILAVVGGVPLAIKWAAQIASDNQSLKDAAATLRGRGSGKQELLSFCFKTMYDALSDTAKDAARLIPYLGAEWNPMCLHILLDQPIDVVKMSIHEISDRGIIFAVDDNHRGGYSLLPLTKDFLSNKWNESESLRVKVEDRIADMLSSDRMDGVLFDWPIERRLKFLTEHAREKVKNGEYGKALKLARLAQTWITDAKLRFLEGKIRYEMGERAAGIAHMRQSIAPGSADLETDDILYFAQALLAHGDRAGESEASKAALLAVKKGAVLPDGLISRLIESSFNRRDHGALVDMLSTLEGGDILSAAFERIEPLLNDRQFAYAYEKGLARIIDKLCTSATLDENKKRYYAEKYGALRQKAV
jgi:hypothetical protein